MESTSLIQNILETYCFYLSTEATRCSIKKIGVL